MNTVVCNGNQGGALLTSAEGAQTGKKYARLDVLEDGTTFSVLTNALYGGAVLTTRTWKRGDYLLGVTTAVTVTAGAVLAHHVVG